MDSYKLFGINRLAIVFSQTIDSKQSAHCHVFSRFGNVAHSARCSTESPRDPLPAGRKDEHQRQTESTENCSRILRVLSASVVNDFRDPRVLGGNRPLA